MLFSFFFFFFFNDTATTEIYTLSLHDALPILPARHPLPGKHHRFGIGLAAPSGHADARPPGTAGGRHPRRDRKSTRLNSSHVRISYAVFCLKKKNKKKKTSRTNTG